MNGIWSKYMNNDVYIENLSLINKMIFYSELLDMLVSEIATSLKEVSKEANQK